MIAKLISLDYMDTNRELSELIKAAAYKYLPEAEVLYYITVNSYTYSNH